MCNYGIWAPLCSLPIKEWLIFVIKESSNLAFQMVFQKISKPMLRIFVTCVHMMKDGIGD